MANNNSALEQLKSFLNELFQFDSQDLDFGVYKILHYKRKEIKDFIDTLLVDKVKEQLQTLTTEEGKRAMQHLKDLEFDMLYVNEQAHLPEKYTYQPIEEVFKNKMLP